jgi:ferredoxin-nitrite reductase
LLRSLAQLATTYGSGSLQLTPWQTVLIPDVPVAQTRALELALAALGCSIDATHPAAGVVACAGKPGCAAAATPTQDPAQALIQQLIQQLPQPLDQPINIHVSGCEKACAQPYASDIALLGVEIEENGLEAFGEGLSADRPADRPANRPIEGYEIYLPLGNQPFGRRLSAAMPVAQAISQVVQIVRIYQSRRDSPDQSFRQFTQQYNILMLQDLFADRCANECADREANPSC